MTKIITWCELRYLTLAELEALLRTLPIERGRFSLDAAPARRVARAKRGAHPTASAISMPWQTAPRIPMGMNRKRAARRCLMNWCVRLRQLAERDYAALRNKTRPAPRSAGGTKDS
jgi:hypothetical protein